MVRVFLLMTALATVTMMTMVACQRPETPPSPERPPDIATQAEHDQIRAALANLSALAAASGVGDFSSFPVLVVDSFAGEGAAAAAYCQRGADGRGAFVGVLRSTLRRAEARRWEWGDDSFLEMILLHELGHCVFGRGHDDTLLEKEGWHLSFRYGGARGDRFFNFRIQASVMHSSPLLTDPFPESLKRYYVAELAGLRRWASLDDVAREEGVLVTLQRGRGFD